MASSYKRTADLVKLFQQADVEDLGILVDYLTDSGKGRISMTTETCSKFVAAKASGKFSMEVVQLMADELCRFGGNTIMNAFRGGVGVHYSEVVNDVLEHLKGDSESGESVESLELKVLQKIAIQAWERMSPEQRQEFGATMGVGDIAGPAALAAIISAIKLGGFATYQLAVILAQSMAKTLLGRGLSLAANAGLARAIGILAGPVGWILTAIWTAFDLASPAYRVTVPCVIHIAYMRQKMSISVCASCGAGNAKASKFCTECGQSLKKAA